MRIAHLELAGFYNEHMSYQTNCLVRQNRKDGHEVLIVSSNYQWFGTQLQRVPTGITKTEDGAELVRLSYFPSFKSFSHHKFRYAKGVYKTLSNFQPDVILSHDLCYWSVLDVIRYKKEHPEVKLYADTHTAAYNSGQNWLSLHILHRILYRYLIKKALPYLEKYWYIGIGEKQFSHEVYNVPEALMEFYPLGGIVLPVEQYAEKRTRRRSELELNDDELLLLHSGKMDALKRTPELLRAFAAVPNLNAKMVLIGSIPTEMEQEIRSLLEQDARVVYLGWKSGEELLEYLCACDLYCQPGSVSATLQNAICCGCPAMAYPHECYTGALNFGQFFWIELEKDMKAVFEQLQQTPKQLEKMEEDAWKCAYELLDYRALAARLYQSSESERSGIQ